MHHIGNQPRLYCDAGQLII